jgi:hypothetical protein
MIESITGLVLLLAIFVALQKGINEIGKGMNSIDARLREIEKNTHGDSEIKP